MGPEPSAKTSLGSRLCAISAALVISVIVSTPASAQRVSASAAPPGSVQHREGIGSFGYSLPDTIYFPSSSVERAEDAGRFAHTNYVLRTTKGARPAPMKSFTEAETRPLVVYIGLARVTQDAIRQPEPLCTQSVAGAP
jgi:hypothetical protein